MRANPKMEDRASGAYKQEDDSFVELFKDCDEVEAAILTAELVEFGLL